MKALYCALIGIAILLAGCDHASGPAKETPVGKQSLSPAAKEEARKYRLEWNRRTLVEDYRLRGKRDPKWDESAEAALELLAHLRTAGQEVADEMLPKLREATRAAVTNGCDDPVIQYMFLRFVFPDEEHNPQQHGEKFRKAAEVLMNTDRPPVRKYYAALRSAQYSDVGTVAAVADVQKWRAEAKRLLNELVRDKAMPGGEVYDALEAFAQSLPKGSKEFFPLYLELEPTISEQWPSEPSLHMFKGWFYCDYAWEARGSGYSGTVTSKGWSGFGERLAIAEAALMKAWSMDPTDPRVARHMITVELGQGQGRQRMEEWFQRAMALDTNFYGACYAKLHYLQPQWYGSHEELLEFASECLQSEKWGGKVPLIVLDAHQFIANSIPRSGRDDYWKRAEVWADLKQAFDKFFRLNPTSTGWHHDYALYAYKAEQWDELDRQLALLGTVNYNFFGGKTEFNKMVELAKQHRSSSAGGSP